MGLERIESEEILNRYKKLNKITLTKKHEEALIFERIEIENLIDIFFWINKANQSSEFIFRVDVNGKFCFYLCKYGNTNYEYKLV